MKKTGKWKLSLGIGCGVAVLVVVGFMGVATWYASRINQQYREVKDSEKALLAATGGERDFPLPPDGTCSPERMEVFLAVRQDLDSWRRTMSTATDRFAVDRDRRRHGGLWDLAKLVNTGSDLMPLYAGFWIARNKSLLAHGMGPREYSYLYRLVYHGGKLPGACQAYREKLMAAYDAQVDPVELIFQGNGD